MASGITRELGTCYYKEYKTDLTVGLSVSLTYNLLNFIAGIQERELFCLRHGNLITSLPSHAGHGSAFL